MSLLTELRVAYNLLSNKYNTCCILCNIIIIIIIIIINIVIIIIFINIINIINIITITIFVRFCRRLSNVCVNNIHCTTVSQQPQLQYPETFEAEMSKILKEGTQTLVARTSCVKDVFQNVIINN